MFSHAFSRVTNILKLDVIHKKLTKKLIAYDIENVMKCNFHRFTFVTISGKLATLHAFVYLRLRSFLI